MPEYGQPLWQVIEFWNETFNGLLRVIQSNWFFSIIFFIWFATKLLDKFNILGEGDGIDTKGKK